MSRRELSRRLRFILSRPHTERMALLAEMTETERRELQHVWRIFARTAQVAPEGDWRCWLILAGRGFGKTRAGAEWIRECAEAEPQARIALIGATLAEARSVMVEGKSGLLAVCPPGRRPTFEPSLRRLTWPNGPKRRSIRPANRNRCADRSIAMLAGQTQKELYLNESLARIDALLHGAVEAQTGTPPTSPQEGQAWLVAASPTGVWSGQAGKIASYQQGQWLFQAPRDGLRVLNRMTGQELFFFGSWKSPTKPAMPSGGAVIDVQARTAIAALVDSLVAAGILPIQ